ncbi:glycerophosphodiester phosphodiesterase family protein [Sporosarcina jiandibaonis]|uniref:glycerophosphodiester phosphodiesterase family protein n=1 Tax=Sporosarcina jiandibaonis TaxID=2715535 RepID=UPI001556795B|nr:glycerophosphodiester phosphodiesterase family protein [Sporosarcina jiandibaonis]
MGRKTKVAISLGAAGIAAWAASKAVAKPGVREQKKALEFDNPIVLANRGGLFGAPENTLSAFTNSASLGVHGFSVDIRLTKDEEILVFHDEYMDKTTNLAGKVADFTLKELKDADAGYQFTDENGEFPFRGKGEKLLTLKELLNRFPHMFVSIDMKESPETYEGSLMPSKLWRLIEETSAEDRVAVTSSYDEQIDRFNLYAQNRVATGAGDDEVKKSYAAYASQFRHLYNPQADMFQVTEKLGIFSLSSEGFISFLSKLNIPVYYKDVDERNAILALIKNGAAGFITSNPELVMQILNENTAE